MKNKIIIVLLLVPILVHSFFYNNNSDVNFESVSFKDYSFDIGSIDNKMVSLLDNDKIVEIDKSIVDTLSIPRDKDTQLDKAIEILSKK